MANTTLNGWGVLSIGETVIGKGKASISTSLQTLDRREPYGASTSIAERVPTQVDEVMKITIDEFSKELVNLIYGNAMSADPTTAPVAPGLVYDEHASCTFELFDRRDTVNPFLVRDGFSALITPEGEVAVNKEAFSECVLNITVTGTKGTVEFTPRS